MKQRIVFIGLFLLMTSCSFNTTKEQQLADSTGTLSTGTIVETPIASTGSSTSTTTGSSVTPSSPATPGVVPSSPTPSQETEDEIVKDFDKEIEELLKTIDDDASKK